MEHETKKKTFKHKGVSVTAFLSPSLSVLLILHVIAFGLFLQINNLSSTLSGLMQRSSVYVTDATSLLAGSSVLSDTCTNYVFRPMLEGDIANVGPFNAYANELQNPRRGKDVLAKFEGSDAPAEAIEQLRLGAEYADYLLGEQLHAIALVSVVYPLPRVPGASVVTPLLPALTEQETAMSDQELLHTAANLLLSKSYGDNKGHINTCVSASVSIIQSTLGNQASQTGNALQSVRGWLVVMALSIVLLMFFIFFMLYRQLFLPVMNSSKLIESGKELRDKKGFREMRLLSSSYNCLKARRDSLDEALRIAAERDALTGLSNRYAYEHYLSELSVIDDEHDTSIAFILLDVNYLKITNDNKGHAAGDELLKESSYCIEKSFKGGKCFRIGGDEFASIILGIKEEDVEAMIKTFKAMQQEKGISVSYGYAYHSSIIEGNVQTLMKQADDAMYVCKEEMHRLKI